MLQVGIAAWGRTYSLNEARELYRKGCYEEAAPTFKRELKKKPQNGSINHWYGVCLYKMGEFENAVPYLKKGVSRKVGVSYYYLGKTYAALYRFDDAIEAYEGYIDFNKRDKRKPSEDVTELIAQAKRGKRMMRGVERVQVIDSLVVDSAAFFDFYRLSAESGRIVTSKHLPVKTPHRNEVAIAHVPQRGDMIYAGFKVEDNYDLYVSNHLLGQGWMDFHSMSEVLNTADNQNYPFMLSDGQTLYFAQDGEAGMGGYDIFVTMFNSERGDYMLPQNMGMPFNSPYNDFMMAIDETLGVGWFVTDRNQIPGKLTIYIFLPNEKKSVYPVDKSNLTSLARLTSISDTWPKDADYSDILDAIECVETLDVVRSFQEFTFVVGSGIVYTHPDDFKNAEALRYYNQARTLRQKIEDMNITLMGLREMYIYASEAEKQTLTPQILKLENELLNLKETPMMYENRARRAELAYLNIPIE